VSGPAGIQTIAEQKLVSEIFHQLSQPLCVLECGLELSLHHDRTATDFRRRVKVLLKAAEELHRRLRELRARDESGDVIPRRERVPAKR